MLPATKNTPLYHHGTGFLITSDANNEIKSRQLKFDFDSGSGQLETERIEQTLHQVQSDSNNTGSTKYTLGIHFQLDTHSYRFSLSHSTTETKDAQLHIYYTTERNIKIRKREIQHEEITVIHGFYCSIYTYNLCGRTECPWSIHSLYIHYIHPYLYCYVRRCNPLGFTYYKRI